MIYGHTSKEFSTTTTNSCDEFVSLRDEELKNGVHGQTISEMINELLPTLIAIRNKVDNLAVDLFNVDVESSCEPDRIDNVAYGIARCLSVAQEICPRLDSIKDRIGGFEEVRGAK